MIVVTGGAGFIGSCVVGLLNAMGRKDIAVVDSMEEGDLKVENLKRAKIAEYHDKRDFLKLVLRDQLTEKVDTLIHMGACSSTVLQDADYFQKNNFQYSCHLAQWAIKHNMRFIYASSAATYGDGSLGYSDDDALTPQLKPLNLYGDSKHKFDLWVLQNGLHNRLAGLKFFNVFGPNEYHKGEMMSVVAKSYERVAQHGKMALFKSYKKEYADGEQQRDFIYIKDVLDVIEYFLENPQVNGIYNVGTGEARSWNDLAKALFAAVGKDPRIDYIEMPDVLRERYQYHTQADMTKLRNAGYTIPFTSLEDAVKDYVKYLSVKNHY